MILNWYGSFSQGQGYSGSSEKICIALEKLGVDVRVITFANDNPKNITKEGMDILKKPFKLGKVGICYGFPNAFSSIINDKKIGFTMFETDRLPNGKNEWAGITGNACDATNKMDMLFVPSEHNKQLFIKEGTKIPVKVVRLGFDPKQYMKVARPTRDTFTFLMLGTLTIRKNPAMAVNAFMSLFQGRKDVKLVLKTSGGTLAHITGLGENIEIIDRYSTVDEMFTYYKEADCFLFPSRGEGFGLPPLEAMATGLPTILSDNTGLSEFCDINYNYPVKTEKMSPAFRFPKEWGKVGNWYEPNYDQFKSYMKEVYENRDKAYIKGLLASDWVFRNFTFEHTAQRILDLIKVLE